MRTKRVLPSANAPVGESSRNEHVHEDEDVHEDEYKYEARQGLVLLQQDRLGS